MTRNYRRAVGVFSDYQNLEMAVNELRSSGFPMNQILVITPDPNARHWLNGITVRDRFDHTRYGFPTERVSFYQDRLSRGDYLVIVEGTDNEIRRAEAIFNHRRIQDWRIYDDMPDSERHFASVGRKRRSVGVFRTRKEAEDALHELRNSGFPMDRISVIAKDADRDDDIAGAPVRENVGNKADEGATVGAVSGGVVGGLTGLLVGLGILAIPGIGPVMLAGATATTIATTLSGTAIGAVTGGLLGALIGLGIPEERARVYHDRVVRGQYLVIVDGTQEEIDTAHAILGRRGIEEYGVYDTPDAQAVPVVDATTARAVPPVDVARNKYAVGLFPNLRQAEQAVGDLRNAGFPLSLVSLVARHFDRREPFSGLDLRDRFDAMRMGLPDHRAHFYNDRIERGDYMVIVNGTPEEVDRAASILRNRGIQEWHVYDPTTIDYVRPTDTHYTVNPAVTNVFARNLEPQGPLAGLHLRDRLDAMRMGLPSDRVHFYNDRIAGGNYVVVVHGTEDEIRLAASILNNRRIEDFGIYDAPDFTPDLQNTDYPDRISNPAPNVVIIDRRQETI